MVRSPHGDPSPQYHAVRFYTETDSLSAVVAAFLGSGFVNEESGIVIARAAHRLAIADALRKAHFDLDALEHSGKLLLLDAEATLAQVLVNGTPDPVRFDIVVRSTIEGLCTPATRGVRAYDEMVDLLWKRDRPAAVAQLEQLWDRLTIACRCALLCGHAVDEFCQTPRSRAICAQHSHVVGDNGFPHPAPR